MSCERFRNALAGLATGAPAASALEAHLEECVGCRAELASLRRALELADANLAALGQENPGPALAARIRQAVAADAARRRPLIGWRPWHWAGAAVASAALLVLALWSGTRAPVAGPGDGAVARLTPPADERPDRHGAPIATPSASLSVRAATRNSRHAAAPALANRPAVEPAVLVPPGQAEALERFVDELRDRTVQPGSLLVADPTAELRLAPIRIESVEIAPLDPDREPGPRSGSDRERS